MIRSRNGTVVAADLIDMPGHERFVRTMIAGASGIDAVLLVVAVIGVVLSATPSRLKFSNTASARMRPMLALLTSPRVASTKGTCSVTNCALRSTSLTTREAAELIGCSRQQVVDLTGVAGTYVGVAMLLAMAEQGVPADKEPPFKDGEP